ncbi:MFS transporter [Clostridium minihomine]|uniref:MFS transporter n=1 Tax=Clostridium minihomine TaxID=2045012 RepID=UPI001FB25EF4|nr:glycoside-pentoside-hexuronide (GPH):cation symporter [Clostridium minihomine]
MTFGTRVAYGCGDTACNVVYGMITTLLTLFYTDYVGLPVATVGIVMLVSRVFDGMADIIMGFIVNRTNTKWGKARPWIIWMSVPYCVTAVALFTVPQTNASLQFWYIFVVYNLCTSVLYTAINVPYGTMSTLMTRSSHERDMLSIFRMCLAPVGRIVAVTFTMPVVKLFGDDQAAWAKAMAMWSVFALAMLIICFVNCKETVTFEALKREKIPVGTNVKALLTNQYFWSTLMLWTVTCVHYTVVGTSLPYYCKYIFHNDKWMYSVLYLAETGMMIVGAMLCPLFLRRFGKRNISLCGAIIAVLAQLAFFFNTNSFQWALITSLIRALGEAPLIALVFGMMGDVVEFGQWKYHIRQESLVFAGGTVGFKFGTGVASAIMAALLTQAGYISSAGAAVVQPESAISMIRNIYLWGPVLLWSMAVVILLLYKLDKKHSHIMSELLSREARGEM